MMNRVKVLLVLLCVSLCSFFPLSAQTVSSVKPDTTIIVENCIEKTFISKMDYTLTETRKLDCYWDGADVYHREYLVYLPESEKCYYGLSTIYFKGEEKKSKDRWGTLNEYHTHRFGIGKMGVDTVF